MDNEKMFMGTRTKKPAGKTVKTIILSVTENCNLICKYCYLTGKNSKNRMTFDTGKKVVDYFLKNRELFNEDVLSFEFVGGEPLLEIELIDKICDYFIEQLNILKHPWINNYLFGMSSNGLLYSTKKVQDYINKHKGHLSIGLSVDGNKRKHDLQRIKLDGTGSYDDVAKSVSLWIKQFPNQSTKATFTREDLTFLKDSVISLWDMGIKDVFANLVSDDLWQEGDDIVFEKQLIELADYIIDKRLWKDHNVRFFDYRLGLPLTDREKNVNFCGTGKILAVDTNGNFYPCLRFLDFSLNNKKSLCIGNYEKGIDTDKLRPFYNLSLRSQSTKECINCEVGSACAWCSACNYDMADTETVFQRKTYLCKMQKANARACNYFWDKLKDVIKEDTPRDDYKKEINLKSIKMINKNCKYLFIITSDNITPHCNYRNAKKTNNTMTDEIFNKGLEFANKNGMIPVILGNSTLNKTNIMNITDSAIDKNDIIIYDNNINNKQIISDNCILLISKDNINNLNLYIRGLYPENSRINIILEDVKFWSDNNMEEYKTQLKLLSDFIFETYENKKPVRINILTDILNLKSMRNCDAGVDSYALAPNGKLYVCPAFYFDNPDDNIGDTDNGIKIKNEYLLDINSAECCLICDAYHCKRCKYENKKYTGEINIPSKNQCVTSHIERNTSRLLQQRLIEKEYINPERRIIKIDYLDPTELIIKGKRQNNV